MRLDDTSHRRIRRVGTILLIVCLVVTATTGNAAGATNTSVTLSPDQETVSVGDTVAVDVIVDNVDNGVNSYSFTAEVNDSDVAEITDVTLQGTSDNDTLTSVDISDDGSSVSVSAGAASHTDGLIASVTVQTTGTGTIEIQGNNIAIGDSDANAYSIESVNTGIVTVQGQSTELNIQPTTRTVADGSTATVDIVAPGAESGVGSYEFNASVANASTAAIEDVTLVGANESDSLTDVTLSADGSSVSVAVGSGTSDDGRIATLQIGGQQRGSTELSVTDAAIGDADSNAYVVSSVPNSTIRVQAPPKPVVEDSEPTDIDQDGTYEDVNGDGKFDIVDVNAVFQNRNKEELRQSEAFYDYNGDGKFDIVDISALLRQS